MSWLHYSTPPPDEQSIPKKLRQKRNELDVLSMHDGSSSNRSIQFWCYHCYKNSGKCCDHRKRLVNCEVKRWKWVWCPHGPKLINMVERKREWDQNEQENEGIENSSTAMSSEKHTAECFTTYRSWSSVGPWVRGKLKSELSDERAWPTVESYVVARETRSLRFRLTVSRQSRKKARVG